MFRKKFWILGLSLLLVSFLFVSCRPPTEPEGIASISVDKMVMVEGDVTWDEEVEQCVCQNVVFQFIVSNDGEETLYNISVSDLIPSGLEYIPGSESGVPSPGGTLSNPVWNFPGPLVSNSTIHGKFVAHVGTEGEHENCVKVQAETDNGVVVNDEDCAVVEGTICELEHKMQNPQYPDVFNGWDVYSCRSGSLDEMIQVADDWKCSETGLVKNIRFWGSWKDDNVGQISGFNVEVYSNNLTGGYSHPDVLLWESFIDDYTSQEIQTPVPQGWYNPFTDSHEDYNHNAHYRYDITDIEEPFYQEEGIIYWLSVWPLIDGHEVWGWKSSEDHWSADACWSVHLPQTPAVDWQELYEPTTFVQSLDLAFIIHGGGGEVPCQCGEWDDVKVSWSDPTTCQSNTWAGNCGESLSLAVYELELGSDYLEDDICISSGINCTLACEPSYSWVVTGPQGYEHQGYGFPFCFKPTHNDNYTVVLNATCDGIECESCTITLKVGLSMPQCESGEWDVGDCDDFNLPTEATSPSQALLDWITADYGNSDTRDCDENVLNRYWAHTFSGLEPPDCCHIESATLEIKVKNNDISNDNDSLLIGFISDTGDSWDFATHLSGWVAVGSVGTITVDLSDVYNDGNTNLLNTIESEGFLDVAVQDDSMVDCAIIHVSYGP